MTEETTQFQMPESVESTAPAAPATAEPAASDAGLTLNDLLVAYNFINVVAQRGGIQAKEMSTVGTLHDRLFKFLNAQGAFDSKQQDSAS